MRTDEMAGRVRADNRHPRWARQPQGCLDRSIEQMFGTGQVINEQRERISDRGRVGLQSAPFCSHMAGLRDRTSYTDTVWVVSKNGTAMMFRGFLGTNLTRSGTGAMP